MEAEVSVGFAGICVTERGRLLEHPLLDWAMRAALLVDLARKDVIALGADEVQVPSCTVGFAPLDAAQRHLANGGTLDACIRRGTLGVRDVVDAVVAEGTWSARPHGLFRRLRYDTGQPKDRWGRTAERHMLQPLVGLPTSPEAAAVLLLAWAAGLEYQYQPVDDLIERTGTARWLCQLAWDIVSSERIRNRSTLRLGGLAGGRP